MNSAVVELSVPDGMALRLQFVSIGAMANGLKLASRQPGRHSRCFGSLDSGGSCAQCYHDDNLATLSVSSSA